MQYSSCIMLGYLFGCINPAFLIGKHRGFDIREKGSKNAGATNTMLLMGFRTGLFVAVFDIFKAFLAFHALKRLFPELQYAGLVAGLACVTGHMFPIHMKFKGGKGIASYGGVILSIDWRLFLIMLLLVILTALITNYGIFSMLFAVITFPLTVGLIGGDWTAAVIISAISLLIVYRHKENFIRFFQGQERGISSLWEKENYQLPCERQ